MFRVEVRAGLVQPVRARGLKRGECPCDGAQGVPSGHCKRHLGSGFQLPGYKPLAPGGLWAAYAQGLVHAPEELSLATGKG